MKHPLSLPLPASEYYDARRLYLAPIASGAVTAAYLRVALLALAMVSVALVVLNIRTLRTFRNFKPLVIRIDEVGRAEAIKYTSLEYKPRDAEIRYFLIQFVSRHYSRRLATVRDDYATSLYFLDGRLADAVIEANRKEQTIERFLAGAGEEIDVAVKNVSIEDLREPPYKATVDFEKIYYSRAEHLELRRERYIANLVFVVKENVPNSIIPVNPLGIAITYFREDQGFN
jgi:type IV secretory pathway TrbF-like protein